MKMQLLLAVFVLSLSTSLVAATRIPLLKEIAREATSEHLAHASRKSFEQVVKLPSTIRTWVEGQPSPALFVFGDSYVDNGNRNNSDGQAICWQQPYGETWPGKPSGRCSDGKVMSDWIAEHLDLPPPTAYTYLRSLDADIDAKKKLAEEGVNFAVAGSGVFRDFGFRTFNGQISWLKELTTQGIVTQEKLAASYVLISTSSNDYFNFVSKKRSSIYIPYYIAKVVTAVADGIKELYAAGVRTFIISNVMPLGCLPAVKEVVNATDCYKIGNAISYIHNSALSHAVCYLQSRHADANIIIANLNKAFLEIEDKHEAYGFGDLLACCDPEGGGISCGLSNVTYDVCDHPKASFYWDSFHLTGKGHFEVTKLFYEGDGFTDPGPNLKTLLQGGR